MPLIEVQSSRRCLIPSKSIKMIQLLADATVSIEGEDMRGGSRFQKSRAANGASAASLSS
jgi:hypothetical protein